MTAAEDLLQFFACDHLPEPLRAVSRPFREMAALGYDVHVVHLYPTDARTMDGGVTHHFVASGRIARSAADIASRLRQRDPALYEPAFRAVEAVRALQPDIVHVHGIGLNLNLFLLSHALGRRNIGHRPKTEMLAARTRPPSKVYLTSPASSRSRSG